MGVRAWRMGSDPVPGSAAVVFAGNPAARDIREALAKLRIRPFPGTGKAILMSQLGVKFNRRTLLGGESSTSDQGSSLGACTGVLLGLTARKHRDGVALEGNKSGAWRDLQIER